MIYNEFSNFSLEYPNIVHPLFAEDIHIKNKIMDLINYFKSKHYYNFSNIVNRIEDYKSILYTGNQTYDSNVNHQNIDDILGDINLLKFNNEDTTILDKFKQIFIFDCIFILAINNKDIAGKIIKEFQKYLGQDYYSISKKYDLLFQGKQADFNDDLLSNKLLEVFLNVQNYIKSEKEYTITFVATMSAVKSDLINALIGYELAVSNNGACIANYHSLPIPSKNVQLNLNGKTYSNITKETALKLTSNQTVTTDIFAYFNSIISEKKYSLIDTPEANNSISMQHKELAYYQLIKNETDILIYVFPVDKNATNDDIMFLDFIKKYAKYKKIIFVVTMMESCEEELDDIDTIIKNITDFIVSQGFEDVNVCPVSAKLSILLSKIHGNYTVTMSKKQILEFKTLCENFSTDYFNLSKYYKNVISTNFHHEYSLPIDIPESKINAYINSGIPCLQELINKKIEEVKEDDKNNT